MAYDFQKLIAVSPLTSSGSTLWHYLDLNSTLGPMLANGFFAPSSNTQNLAALIKPGDAMCIVGSDGAAWYRVTAIAPVSVSQMTGD